MVKLTEKETEGKIKVEYLGRDETDIQIETNGKEYDWSSQHLGISLYMERGYPIGNNRTGQLRYMTRRLLTRYEIHRPKSEKTSCMYREK